jgi:hypothetical protein
MWASERDPHGSAMLLPFKELKYYEIPKIMRLIEDHLIVVDQCLPDFEE